MLDGWGEAPDADDNAIALAETPTMDSLKQGAPDHWRTVKAHGTAVGLPTDDDMGNSEVTSTQCRSAGSHVPGPAEVAACAHR